MNNTNNTAIRTSNHVINRVLDIVEPFLVKIIEKRKAEALAKNEKFTSFDEYFTRLNLTFDLTKAMGKYFVATDTIKKISFREVLETIEIRATITREGKDYFFDTNTIYAGGHNIQCLHLRYLIGTNLPKLSSNEPAALVKAKIAHLTKEQRLEADVKLYEGYVLREENTLIKLKGMTEAEIIDAPFITGASWDRLNDGGKKNYGTPEAFNAHIEEEKARLRERHKVKISYTTNYIKSLQKDLNKKKAKLQEHREG